MSVSLFNLIESPTKSIYLLAEHRRHQILPGFVRDGDIGFQRIVVFVPCEGHHDLGRHSLFKGVDDEGLSDVISGRLSLK